MAAMAAAFAAAFLGLCDWRGLRAGAIRGKPLAAVRGGSGGERKAVPAVTGPVMPRHSAMRESPQYVAPVSVVLLPGGDTAPRVAPPGRRSSGFAARPPARPPANIGAGTVWGRRPSEEVKGKGASGLRAVLRGVTTSWPAEIGVAAKVGSWVVVGGGGR